MSEVVRMLEGDGLAERWEASQRVESSKGKTHEFSSSERYSDLTDDSSLLIQAMELSGPRSQVSDLKIGTSSLGPQFWTSRLDLKLNTWTLDLGSSRLDLRSRTSSLGL
ncbi:hypothetical protein L1049_002244 [Liquidambar formosana]|uniref:Uncharacterized protein n=1 Tax=Liquidambar formosana TaxID=63359 RepID=A0AAP0NJC6_LIQFO